MTAPTMLPDVSEQAKDDLAPSCDILVRFSGDVCGAHAEWFGVMVCCSAIRLMCPEHHAESTFKMYFTCAVCEEQCFAIPYTRVDRL